MLRQLRSKIDTDKEQSSANGKGRKECICKCGRELEETTVSRAYPSGLNGISCSSCECTLTNAMFHCPGNSNMQHLNGFDLCLECGEARIETQDLQSPICPGCGKKMVAIFARNAYSFACMFLYFTSFFFLVAYE